MFTVRLPDLRVAGSRTSLADDALMQNFYFTANLEFLPSLLYDKLQCVMQSG